MAEERLGASFSIDVSQLQSGLRTANKLIRESQSEFKAAAAKMDDWTKSEDGLKAKLKSLNDIIKVQEEKVKALGDNYEKELADGMDESSDRAIYLRTQMNNAEAALEKSKKEAEDTEDALDDLGDEAEDTGDDVKKASEGFTVMKGVLSNLVTDAIRKAIDAFKELGKQTIEAGANFEAAMSQVQAVSGATAEDMELLTEKAEEMGAKTKFSATESAEAFNYMAMAGWKTEQMIGGIEGIMNLAAASGSDLATTSDIVTDALTAMGYAAEDAGKLADVMAAASSNANTNVEMMGQTFQYAAPLVGALGYSMEDTAVAIGLMANAGIKGEKAGTSLRAVMSRLSAPPKECADAMEALNIQLTHSDGTMKPLQEVIDDLRKAFDGMSESEKTANAKHLAGQEAMSGLLAIVNAAPEDYKKLTDAVAKSDGAAQRMADTMNDNVKGAMTLFKSQVEGVQISIYNKLEPSLRGAIKSASKLVSDVNWNKFGETAKKALDKAVKGLKWIVDNYKSISKGLGLIVGAFAVAKVLTFTKALSGTTKAMINVVKSALAATAATNANTAAEAANTTGKGIATVATGALTAATNLLNAAWKSNPIGLVIAGLTALVAIIATVIKKTNEMTEEEKAHQEALEEQREQLEENRSAWDDLTEAQQNSLNVGMTEVSNLELLWKELQGIVDQNGKVKEGYEKRASFIADTLAEKLGLEISLNGDIIQGYKDIQKEIDATIEKKKAQILLESQEEAYTEALNKRAEAIRNTKTAREELTKAQTEYTAATRELAEYEDEKSLKQLDVLGMAKASKRKKQAEEELALAQSTYDQQLDLFDDYSYTIGNYEKNLALFHEGNYEDMTTATWQYVKEYQGAGEAEKAVTEQRISDLEFQLQRYEEAYETSGDNIYKSLIDQTNKELQNEKDKLMQYESTTKSGLQKTEVVWSNSLASQLSKLTGSKIEFQNAGNGLVQAVVNGEKIGAPKSKEEMAKLTTDAIKEVSSQNSEAKKAGENLIEGINKGIKNQDKQSSVFTSIKNFGSKLLGSLKQSLQEKSPSKATEEMGEFLDIGLWKGIDKKSGWLQRKIKSFGEDVISDIGNVNDMVGNSLNYNRPAINVQGVGGAMGKSVVVNQYNTYSQAHSRYEIYKSKQQTAAAVRLALGSV